MYVVDANSTVAGTEFFWVLSISESIFFFLIFFWQLLAASEDFNVCSTAAPVLPALIGKVQHWFTRRHWLTKFFKLGVRINCHYFLPPARSASFFLFWNSLPHAGFFDTPARCDIPPPCRA